MRQATKEEQESIDRYVRSISVDVVPVDLFAKIRAELYLTEKEMRRAGSISCANGISVAITILDKYVKEWNNE